MALGGALQGRTVLLVDDEESFVNFMASTFEDVGAAAYPATSYMLAIALTARLKPDAVVLDLRLGEHHCGLDLLDEIRRLSPASQILMLSGLARVDEAAEAMRRGAIGFLRKPASAHRIEREFERVFTLRR